MDRQKLQDAQSWVKSELERSARFWLDHGMDKEHGGVYTCLDRKGEIYSTDKSVWMQGRCGWIFAFLCHNYGVKEEWLEASRSCLDFMDAHCFNHEAGDRMYFTVTAEGMPLRQRRYYFSEAFCAIANAEYYGVTGDKSRLERARQCYDLYWDLSQGKPDPVGMGPKTIPETRSGRAFGTPMIMGEGYRTFPQMLYTQFMGEVGTNDGFAATMCIIVIIIALMFFFIQKLLGRVRYGAAHAGHLGKQLEKVLKGNGCHGAVLLGGRQPLLHLQGLVLSAAQLHPRHQSP